MKDRWVRQLALRVATLAGLGTVAYAPGTCATGLTLGFIFVVSWLGVSLPIYLAIVCGSVLVAYTSISVALPLFYNDADPSPIVIDEVVGTLITFAGIALSLKTLLLGFVLFRMFDIAKPFGIKRVERLDGPAGILADGIVAGLYANGFLHLYLWFFA